jgi:hypothetical protein
LTKRLNQSFLKLGVLLQSCCLLLLLCPTARAADSDQRQGPQAGVPGPELKVVEKWRGTWDVKAVRRQPQPAQDVSYTETFDWVLDGHFLRSETTPKSDGGKSMSMVWFDRLTKTYRWVIFDASGFAFELPPPTWNENTQTMEWKSGAFAPTSYTGFATFKDRDTIRWKSLWKDWKGTVILDMEGTSTRRK